jgi:thymidylate synthase
LEERATIFNDKKEKGEIVVSEFESVGDMNAWTNKLLNNTIPTRAISLMWNQRSVDTFLGLPFNIASYGLLLEIIAKEVNMVPDDLIGNLGDVHLYSNHIEQAKEQIGREPFELPTLKFSDWYKNANIEKQSEIVFNDWIESMKLEDFTIENYQSHPAIKAPLSN